MDLQSLLDRFGTHVETAWQTSERVQKFPFTRMYTSVLVHGFGLAGSIGDVLSALDARVPIMPWKQLKPPHFLNSKTLVLVIALDHDTESIAFLKEIASHSLHILCVTREGPVAVLARSKDIATVCVPESIPANGALPYILMPMLRVLHQCKLITNLITNSFLDVASLVPVLSKTQWHTSAKHIAQKCKKKRPVILSTPRYRGVGAFWRHAVVHIGGVAAYHGVMPDVTFDDLATIRDDMMPILLRDDIEFGDDRRRVTAVKKYLIRHDRSPIEVAVKGQHTLTKLITALYLGLLVGFSIAEQKGRNPDDRLYRDEFRQELKRVI